MLANDKKHIEEELKINSNDPQVEQKETQEVNIDNVSKEVASENDSNNNILQEIEKLNLELADYKDKYLRLNAEFDNYRKRTAREKLDLMKYSSEQIFKDILPLIDNFERALIAMEKTEDIIAVKDGIDLIYKNFKDYLTKEGVKEIEAIGKDFDTDHHEAITKIKTEGLERKVVEVVEKGYFYQDKILRFSKVIVGE